jgi:hypothetical protein
MDRADSDFDTFPLEELSNGRKRRISELTRHRAPSPIPRPVPDDVPTMDHDISDFDTFPLEELWLRRESPIAATEDATQSTRDLADSATPLPRMSQELKSIRVLPSGSIGTDDFVAPRTSVLKSLTTLRFLSLILHWTLVGIHSALIFMWVKGPEHRLVISMEHQGIASLLLTISSTAFTTVGIFVLFKTVDNYSSTRYTQRCLYSLRRSCR